MPELCAGEVKIVSFCRQIPDQVKPFKAVADLLSRNRAFRWLIYTRVSCTYQDILSYTRKIFRISADKVSQ